MRLLSRCLAGLLVIAVGPAWPKGSEMGTLRGRVTVRDNGAPVITASVQIIQLERSASTDAEGNYEIRNVPPGRYDVISHMHALTDEVRTIRIVGGQETVADFQLSLAPLRHEVTVTATGHEETAFESFQAVTTLDSFELVGKNAFSLGEVVKDQPGVNTRSFGLGSSRPVLRGFDGDRVLILADGLPTGTLSAQSGEHAEPMDAAHLDRLEIVKGPATLLYGSNALGGVVNAVTEHHMIHEHPHQGMRGHVIAEGASNNNRASGGGGAEYGYQRWMVWGHGSRQVSSDYSSPEGRIENSKTRLTSGNVGFGWFGAKPFFSLGYYFNKGRLGIPFAGEFHHHEEDEDLSGESEEAPPQVDEVFTWQNVRMTTGLLDVGPFIEKVRLAANFSRWMHRELEGDVPATAFDNKLFNLRGTVEQRKRGPLVGTFGFHVSRRDYRSEGEEALAPPVQSTGLAAFTLQELQFERAQLQFGARVEHAGYDPLGAKGRSFTGLSAAAGFSVSLWDKGNLVANYTHSYRVPALEELYNNGPHIGNLTYETGNPDLQREASDGLDLSVRHHGGIVHAQANFFYYHIRDFVYLASTGEVRDGLRAADYSQADTRFLGGEAQLDLELFPELWLNFGMDTVDAQLTGTGTPLPRIPPLRGRFGVDARYKGFAVKPEVVAARAQNQVNPGETRTAGYTVVNLNASYILAQAHTAHVFAVTVFNLGDRLYRNHLSFIKDLAPEMGRGIRFSYSLRFY